MVQGAGWAHFANTLILFFLAVCSTHFNRVADDRDRTTSDFLFFIVLDHGVIGWVGRVVGFSCNGHSAMHVMAQA